MQEVTLLQVLEAREKRAQMQKELIKTHKTTLVCFTMNIAGPVKVSPLIERCFWQGVKLLEQNFSDNIVYSKTDISVTGCEAMFCISQTAQKVKDICVNIEENHPLGRLFDMDVISPDGVKLERKNMRGCIVCGAKGRECAAGRLHTVSELQTVTNNIITNHFFKTDCEHFGALAGECLKQEVYTTPKAGLVDKNNNGSHKDMDVALFKKSADALVPYFSRCFEIGYKYKTQTFEETFTQLRKEGIKAEQKMFETTGGVNTHKGACFSMGVLCCAVGLLWNACEIYPKVDDILSACANLSKKAVEQDFAKIQPTTAGARAYCEYNLKGIRGEVANGFLSVKNIALPIFKSALESGYSRNDAGAITLVHLIANVEDTTIYNRGGKAGADFAKTTAKQLLTKTKYPTITQMEWLDKEFIARNLSAGGCADLLAVTYFLSNFK